MCKCCDKSDESTESEHKKKSTPPPPPPPQQHQQSESVETKEEPEEKEVEISEVKEPEPMWTKSVSSPAVPTTSAYCESPFEVKKQDILSDSETSSYRDLVLKHLPDARDISVDEQIDLQPIS